MIYLIIFFILFLFGLAEVLCNERCQVKRGYLPFAILLMGIILFAGARDSAIGLDTLVYERIHGQIWEIPISVLDSFGLYNVEYGYALLNLLAPNFQCLLMLTAIAGAGIKVYSSNELGIKNKYALLLFYFSSVFVFYDMGIMREGLAIAIIYLSFPSIRKRNLLKFMMYMGIAMMFHITAVMAIPLYFVGNREFTRRTYYMVLLFSFMVALLGNIPTLLKIISDILNNAYISHKLDVYFSQSEGFVLRLAPYIKRILILLLFLEAFKHPKLCFGDAGIIAGAREISENTWLYINAYYISLIEMIIFSFMPIMSTRGSAYLYSCQMFVFCEMVSGKRKRVLNIIYYIIFSALSLATLYNSVYHSAGNIYLPYEIFL